MGYGWPMICSMICRSSTSLSCRTRTFLDETSLRVIPIPLYRLLFQSAHFIEFVPYAGYTGLQWKEPCVDNRRFCGPGSA